MKLLLILLSSITLLFSLNAGDKAFDLIHKNQAPVLLQNGDIHQIQRLGAYKQSGLNSKMVKVYGDNEKRIKGKNEKL